MTRYEKEKENSMSTSNNIFNKDDEDLNLNRILSFIIRYECHETLYG